MSELQSSEVDTTPARGNSFRYHVATMSAGFAGLGVIAPIVGLNLVGIEGVLLLLSSPALFLLGVICGRVGLRTTIGKISLALNLVGLVGIVSLILFLGMVMSSIRC